MILGGRIGRDVTTLTVAVSHADRRSGEWEIVARDSAPQVFRILLPAIDPEVAGRFHEQLLGTPQRLVAPGRVYFDCGPVILGILDYSAQPASERSRPTEAVYLATSDLEEIYRRAKNLGCLSKEYLHNDPTSPLGEIQVRPWGERSFYVDDPSGNSLCFVDGDTLFRGTPDQVAALEAASRAG